MNKREAYGKLVKDARKFYQEQDESSFLMPLDETFGVCKEINLYTYWLDRTGATHILRRRRFKIGSERLSAEKTYRISVTKRKWTVGFKRIKT